MRIHKFGRALKRVSSQALKLSQARNAALTSNAQPGAAAELVETFRSLNKQLLCLAPHMAHVFCCEASMVKFIKTLVESAGYEPEIRDGGFYFDLFIDEDEMTWDEYFGEEHEQPAR